jgi:hypothetical protein
MQFPDVIDRYSLGSSRPERSTGRHVRDSPSPEHSHVAKLASTQYLVVYALPQEARYDTAITTAPCPTFPTSPAAERGYEVTGSFIGV